MLKFKILKGSLLLIILIIQTLSYNTEGSPFFADIRESAEIGPEGGDIMAKDPESGISVSISIPKGALPAKTTITVLLHGTKQPGVLARTHINGRTMKVTILKSPGDGRNDQNDCF